MSQNIHVEVKIEGRDELCLDGRVSSSGVLEEARLSGIGGPHLLDLLEAWRPKLIGELSSIPLPEGREPESLLLRELLLKAQGKWDFPYEDKTLCYCRQISTEVVDQAIIFGAHTPEEVSEQTSASTACGTCREDVEKLLKCRLGD